MKYKILLPIILILSAKISFGQTIPKISVLAPTEVKRNEYLVQLSVNVENEKSLPPLENVWTILEDGVRRSTIMTFERGKYVIVPTANTNVITYSVISRYNFEVKKPVRVEDKDNKPLPDAKVYIGDSKTPIKEITVDNKVVQSEEVGGQIKVLDGQPNPNPEPTPTPSPSFPVGKYNLAKTSYELAMQNVSSEDRTLAVPLAGSFDSIAKAINTSQTKLAAGVALLDSDLKLDVTSIKQALKTLNNKVLGSSAIGWQKWDTLYGDEIFRLYSSKPKQINTPEDWATAFRETAIGLRQVK